MSARYQQDMLLESGSGFSMPFHVSDDELLVINLGFGEQRHPLTGETFQHSGVDFSTNGKTLKALATGVVVGVGTDAVHEHYVIIRHGKYEVKYGHIKEAYVSYGNPVNAGQEIASSGDFLHFEVKFDGRLLDPQEFLAMIVCNIEQLNAIGTDGSVRFDDMGAPVKTDYDKDQDEILSLMSQWLPVYFDEIRKGTYAPSERTEITLRNIFSQSASKSYFFEKIPTLNNPLGLSSRANPLASKVQNLLIHDFLLYMATRHNIYLSSWTDDQKKNFLSKRLPTVS